MGYYILGIYLDITSSTGPVVVFREVYELKIGK